MVGIQIPEIAYAVVFADSVLEINIRGMQRTNTHYAAKPTDRFHIGSNTTTLMNVLRTRYAKQLSRSILATNAQIIIPCLNSDAIN